MNERPAKSRPVPAAPFDDPSIPVLTERLLLPEFDLDTTLPAAGDGAAARQAPESPAQAPPPEPKAAAAAPHVLGVDFQTDTWQVEPTPVAPPARPDPQPPAAAPPPTEIAAAIAIPASLMRTGAATVATDAAPPGSTAPRLAIDAAVSSRAPFALPDATQLSASILDELLRHLPPDSEPIVRRHLAPAVDAAIGAAVAQLVPEIRRAVAFALRELVEQAVQAELARLRDRPRS